MNEMAQPASRAARPWCRILADDLTGALDCAAAFAGAAAVPVALDEPSRLPLCAAVEACSTDTRAASDVLMRQRLSACLEWLMQAELSFKKIDSLMGGNTFAELAWLAASGRFRCLVVAPAFPAQRRAVRAGRLIVDGQVCISIREGLRALGADAWPMAEIVIPDVDSDADLDALVGEFAGRAGVLWCGSAGLGAALARSAAYSGITHTGAVARLPSPADIVIASASRHPVLRHQWRRLQGHLSADLVPAHHKRLFDFASPGELSTDAAADALAIGARAIVEQSPAPGLLIAIGGDSLLALCRAAGVQALLAGAPPRAGWGSAQLIGGRWNGVPCLSRSGAFGDADDLVEMLRLVQSTHRIADHAESVDRLEPSSMKSIPMNKPTHLALTIGDPAGIGPEIIVKAAQALAQPAATGRSPAGAITALDQLRLTAFGSRAALLQAAERLGLPAGRLPSNLAVHDVGPVAGQIVTGQVSAAGGEWSYRAVAEAVRWAQDGRIDAIVTAPLCKEALQLAGYPFEGHTEMLAHLTGMRDGVMMLAHGNMRVSHVSTHCALAEVPKRLTPTRLRRVLDVTLDALRALGIAQPRIAVAGLNPHAGEGGILGREDGEIIAPTVQEYAAAGHAVSGPWAGDTVFIKLRASQFDAVVAMYHDQGHIPVKLLGFAIDPATGQWQSVSGVNVTLGLPILRTSVDHGTAFDIAGRGVANADSMTDAIAYALGLVQGRAGTTDTGGIGSPHSQKEASVS